MLLNIDYTLFKESLHLKKENDKLMVLDPIRKKYLVLQPEELVRQLVLLYLLHEKNYNKNRIRTEQGLKVNSLNKRCDILIYDQNIKPVFLIECKSSKVKISQETFDQIAQYNLPLQVQYLLVTNGIQSYCCKMDYENQEYQFLNAVPDAKDLLVIK